MTRDEAIKSATQLRVKRGLYVSHDDVALQVDTLIALGVFTPEEPKPEPPLWEKLEEVWPHNTFSHAPVYNTKHLLELLDRAGLTLVRKESK